MNGAQDLGGMMGFGPVVPDRNEPVFHAEWERRALGLSLCCDALGAWNIDTNRHSRESLHPADYLTSSYYEIRTKGLLKVLAALGLVSPEEMQAGRSLVAPKAMPRSALKPADVAARLARGNPCDRPLNRAQQFKIGERVRARNIHPIHHVRLPRYARGKLGVIEACQGSYVFPDTNAHGKGEDPQWIYSVVFKGTELWGADSDPSLSVAIDCWEPYLEPA